MQRQALALVLGIAQVRTAAGSSHLKAVTSSLLSRCHLSVFPLQVIMVLVVFGVGAIIGDGVLTPAMSVLSSIEGLHQVSHISQGNLSMFV